MALVIDLLGSWMLGPVIKTTTMLSEMLGGSPTLWRGQVPLCSSVGTLKRGEHRTLKRGSD
ncbi:DNA alkylation repair protein [Sesbania bispinosa]|nr:DNA alkylation repair protein [Sesbania bispinosa]